MLTVALLILAFVASCQATCDKGCEVPVKHYEEFGCEPVYGKPGDCCPKYYNCAQLEARSADKCYFKGKTYNLRDRIDGKDTVPLCAASCFCSKNGRKDITCANIECPEVFGNRPARDCLFTYEHDKCCSSGQICPPFNNVAKCEIDGETYYQGQKFYPASDMCKKCICKPGFTGKLVEPFCTTINCGNELRYTANVRNNDAPVYYGNSRCCPNSWIYPSEGDKITPAGETSTEGKVCKFGNKILRIGDKLSPHRDSVHSPEINCECKIPPLVTCIQKPYAST